MIKRFAWFLFKSPQRKWVGWSTLWTDAMGFLHRKFYPTKNEIIWICVGNSNRSASLLQNLVQSMANLQKQEFFGLSVVDCNSKDILDLQNDIAKIWNGPLVFSKTDLAFSRSKIFNMAIAQAPGNAVFICDADIVLPPNLLALYNKNVMGCSAWFPICAWQTEPNTEKFRWFTEGTGIFGANKEQLKRTGVYDESITDWGKEDWDLFFRMYAKGIAPFRSRCAEMRHIWHVPSKPDTFVNMF